MYCDGRCQYLNERKHKCEFEECYGSTIEVNGNRFDNPELLEV